MHLACDWQVADGLHFLHTEANQVHRALCPHTVFITSMGAWKLGGLSLSSPAFITADTVGVIPVSYRDPSMERFMRYQQVCSPHTASCAFLYSLYVVEICTVRSRDWQGWQTTDRKIFTSTYVYLVRAAVIFTAL